MAGGLAGMMGMGGLMDNKKNDEDEEEIDLDSKFIINRFNIKSDGFDVGLQRYWFGWCAYNTFEVYY